MLLRDNPSPRLAAGGASAVQSQWQEFQPPEGIAYSLRQLSFPVGCHRIRESTKLCLTLRYLHPPPRSGRSCDHRFLGSFLEYVESRQLSRIPVDFSAGM
eukprot:TRINITY_DN1719_c0_g2_i1.p1 TRINITY_DN1719_c0_g2~~TRINITY_DN1719_c0_g2_i1.p1  ORF type:complete len:100 (+),score=11.83 TRINITY_DN1719_c0_g2_i1:787-1086(+)